MKESILDVLMYLFENYLDEEDVLTNQDHLEVELIEAGFETHKIERAFQWLESLGERRENSAFPAVESRAFRIYSSDEVQKLDMECRGLLLFLEQVGILDPAQREIIIDKVMDLGSDEMNLSELKWVILIVLMNQETSAADQETMENFIYLPLTGTLH